MTDFENIWWKNQNKFRTKIQFQPSSLPLFISINISIYLSLYFALGSLDSLRAYVYITPYYKNTVPLNNINLLI